MQGKYSWSGEAGDPQKVVSIYNFVLTRPYLLFVSSIDLIRFQLHHLQLHHLQLHHLQLHHLQLQHLQLQHSSLHTLTQSHPPPTMHFSLLSLALLTTSALATTPTFDESLSFHAMLSHGVDLSARQDSGYYPSTRNCTGGGNTCESACGAGMAECPTDDKKSIFCHEETTSQCCSDRSGHACSTGYYCASASEETYCCPNGQGMSFFIHFT
jgi:hypothetical protein